MKHRNRYWRALDDQAKVFSLSANKKDTSIFRLSTTLKKKIDANILAKALELTLEKYKTFKVKMKKGFFWHYLEENPKKPIITKEDEYSFKKINTKGNNDFLFKLTYTGKKINIDYFHILTDGNGGRLFLKEIVYKYLELKYPKEIKNNNIAQDIECIENSYPTNYQKKYTKNKKSPKAYIIKGEKIKDGKIGINHFQIKLKEIKWWAQEKKCSISIFLTAMIAYALYEANYKKNGGKKPINICVPINLKKYFPSKTLSNFVSYMMISLKIKKDKNHTFDDILNMVKSEFEKKLKKEKIVPTISSDGKIINNLFVKYIPLKFKKILVRIGATQFKRRTTMTFSNIGQNEIDHKYSKYINNISFSLAPDWAEKLRCGICSFKDKLVVTFGTNIKDSNIETKFRDMLKEYGIRFKIEGNGVNTISN